MWDLSIYASITEHDRWRRYELIRQFRSLEVDPKISEDGERLEIRYTGNRENVFRLADICESCIAHSVHISRPEY